MVNKTKVRLAWLIAAFMFVNILLSAYLQVQKNAMLSGESMFGDTCFTEASGSGNCVDVQLSEYGKIFGVQLGTLGIVIFSFMFVVISLFAYGMTHRWPMEDEEDLNTTRKFIYFSLVVGSLFAGYFIYLQLFVIDAICKYCMVIDSLTIISAIIFITKFKKPLRFNII